jgi:hypothetical protein
MILDRFPYAFGTTRYLLSVSSNTIAVVCLGTDQSRFSLQNSLTSKIRQNKHLPPNPTSTRNNGNGKLITKTRSYFQSRVRYLPVTKTAIKRTAIFSSQPPICVYEQMVKAIINHNYQTDRPLRIRNDDVYCVGTCYARSGGYWWISWFGLRDYTLRINADKILQKHLIMMVVICLIAHEYVLVFGQRRQE